LFVNIKKFYLNFLHFADRASQYSFW